MTPPEMKEQGLVFVSDEMPGIRRRKQGNGFQYLTHSNEVIRCEAEIERINKLGIPPAYREVWICPIHHGHLQATGRDERKRKQYRYHPNWMALRSLQKFEQLPAFGERLPRLRRRVRDDLKASSGSLEHTLAALVSLLDHTAIRVGNAYYTEENNTYGATTLRSRHLQLDENRVQLKFRGKGGKQVQRTIRSKRLHRILEEIADLPGKELFTFKGRDDVFRPIDSQRLNEYICDGMGLDEVSAKTFRTWSGSLVGFDVAIDAFRESGQGPTIKAMTQAAAEKLANTPAICRSSYVHPKVIGLSEEENLGFLETLVQHADTVSPRSDLKKNEEILLKFLS